MTSDRCKCDLISVCPKEMIFYAPYDRTQKRLITLLNPTRTIVLFKLRSNVPWQYNVNPNCGTIEPYDISEVNVTLNFIDFDKDRTYTHRFCILCVSAPAGKECWETSEILHYLRGIPFTEQCNVRIPIELQPEPFCLCQRELDMLVPADVQKYLLNSQATIVDCNDHVHEESLPHSLRIGCGLGRTIMTILVIITILAAGKL